MNKKGLLSDEIIADDMAIGDLETRVNSSESSEPIEITNTEEPFASLVKKVLVIAIPAMLYEFCEFVLDCINIHLIGKNGSSAEVGALGLGTAIFTIIHAVFHG